ncbi:hypothetical protein [Bradyrhizobium sp. Ash2021]|uniref:hypothetical protein n=1 Tax=Bradyrhizobium sp. Ash2021 TaxID=2954771 RepID=UPI002814F57B|nr:hypothetical protein [Bradyrhizobium sp. Ash2021]WMT76041.1 hypothetical protein NL528_06550 [Bradyrhizobium sp. Ash2021]
MTRAITLVALTCFLVVGAAATSILGRDSVSAARYEVAAAVIDKPLVSNKEAKKDRLAIAALALASFDPPQTQIQAQVQAQAEPQAQTQPQTQAQPQTVLLTEPLRQAYASSTSADNVMPKLADPAAAPKPKAASKPQPQKTYALLSDVQIAGIKERLKLSSEQESYWPPVESALRAVARKIHAKRQVDPGATGVPIDPDSEEVQQLKSAAMPLLFQLREDQKSEVRSLARIIGLEKVAAMI